jgi:hypothetical protein
MLDHMKELKPGDTVVIRRNWGSASMREAFPGLTASEARASARGTGSVRDVIDHEAVVVAGPHQDPRGDGSASGSGDTVVSIAAGFDFSCTTGLQVGSANTWIESPEARQIRKKTERA